jgi:hypothetical protein
MPTHPATQHIELRPRGRLVEYPRKNAAAVDRMCGSIREFGFKIPCLVRSDGEVVDGHLRLKAARKLGITEIHAAKGSTTWPQNGLVACVPLRKSADNCS